MELTYCCLSFGGREALKREWDGQARRRGQRQVDYGAATELHEGIWDRRRGGGGKGLVKPPAGADLVVTNTPSHVNYDLCCACGAGGDLLCCDSCPNSFHLDCVEPALETVPKGAWHCNACYALLHPPTHKGSDRRSPSCCTRTRRRSISRTPLPRGSGSVGMPTGLG